MVFSSPGGSFRTPNIYPAAPRPVKAEPIANAGSPEIRNTWRHDTMVLCISGRELIPGHPLLIQGHPPLGRNTTEGNFIISQPHLASIPYHIRKPFTCLICVPSRSQITQEKTNAFVPHPDLIPLPSGARSPP